MDTGRTLHVAPAFADDTRFATLVVTGVDLEVPVEADLDDDPLQNDRVALDGADGSRRVLEVGDPDVRLDPGRRMYLYRFRDVAKGVYTLSARLSHGRWAPIIAGVVVTRQGATHAGRALSTSAAPAIPEPQPAQPPDVPDEALPDEHGGDFVDQPAELQERGR
jgi:hypothetical protein